MADESDRASDHEIMERARSIKFSRANVPPEPDLGCQDCMGLTHNEAKATCQDFVGCLMDWQIVQRMKMITKNA